MIELRERLGPVVGMVASLYYDARPYNHEGWWTREAECGGLLWLARSLDGRRLCGALAADGRMTDRLTLGYRGASVARDCPIGATGTELRGHEFHYSTIEPAGDALHLEGRFGAGCAGFASPTLLASYLHVHLASDPSLINTAGNPLHYVGLVWAGGYNQPATAFATRRQVPIW